MVEAFGFFIDLNLPPGSSRSLMGEGATDQSMYRISQPAPPLAPAMIRKVASAFSSPKSQSAAVSADREDFDGRPGKCQIRVAPERHRRDSHSRSAQGLSERRIISRSRLKSLKLLTIWQWSLSMCENRTEVCATSAFPETVLLAETAASAIGDRQPPSGSPLRNDFARLKP